MPPGTWPGQLGGLPKTELTPAPAPAIAPPPRINTPDTRPPAAAIPCPPGIPAAIPAPAPTVPPAPAVHPPAVTSPLPTAVFPLSITLYQTVVTVKLWYLVTVPLPSLEHHESDLDMVLHRRLMVEHRAPQPCRSGPSSLPAGRRSSSRGSWYWQLDHQKRLTAIRGKPRPNPIALPGLRDPKPARRQCAGTFFPGAGSRQGRPVPPARPSRCSVARPFRSWTSLYRKPAGGRQGERSLRAGCVAVWISFNLRMDTWV